MFCVKLKRLKE